MTKPFKPTPEEKAADLTNLFHVDPKEAVSTVCKTIRDIPTPLRYITKAGEFSHLAYWSRVEEALKI